MRAPEAPRGWPRAMAPPFDVGLPRVRPSSFCTARNCGAKASLTSKRSTSPGRGPRARAPADRRRGADAHDLRLDAGDAPLDERASGVRPRALAHSRSTTHERRGAVADARRVARGDHAVLLEDRRSFARLHRGLRARVLVLVDDDVLALLPLELDGRDLVLEAPASCAAAQRCCDGARRRRTARG
jgi:hypothetical protein